MSKPSAEITRLFDEIDSTPFGAEERALIDHPLGADPLSGQRAVRDALVDPGHADA